MPAAEAEQMIALGLVFVVHVIGGLMLVWALLGTEQRAEWRNFPRPPRGGEDDGPPPPQPPRPPGARRTPGPPLPLRDAAPSRVRLREPIALSDAYPRPARRPEHDAQPQRAPVPARQRQRRA